ncbi:NAD(P)/FAD-dependent oxidoreductase [Candidatus Parcubacteria bacterium]|nr:MAG: NAD(P)/FAD-dependent oxidoreductase [Candidatus Parcubacteria bacterium]
MTQESKKAIIIGAGPAGLTAAYELLKRTDIKPIVLERDPVYVGGISKTVNYKGNRIDIGGHRFFSKSDVIMKWWGEMLPVKTDDAAGKNITYQNTTRALTEGMPIATGAEGDRVMHVRPRKTRIVYGGKFFAYPVELSLNTLLNLGFWKVLRIGITYTKAVLFPIRPEKTLEDFFINRFGTELYKTFFKSYTEKVWGVSCKEMSAEWGAQRVKGLSIIKAVQHAAKKVMQIGPLSGKSVETSLIEQFLYPTYGPGYMWEIVAEKIKEMGGQIVMGASVERVQCVEGGFVVTAKTTEGRKDYAGEYVFSTTDVKALARMMEPALPEDVRKIADALQYRDFLTVGLLLRDKPKEPNGELLLDTWMYVHEPGVDVGRLQLFHNWNPHMVANQSHGWIGLEYFCNEGDALWNRDDAELVKQGERELRHIGLLKDNVVLDGTVLRQPKAYPGYFGAYAEFPKVRAAFDAIPNLFLIGRNGMHRYNNQDHSMLAAIGAVDNVIEGRTNNSNLWQINTEEEYHEEKKV